jgi:conjugal transfer pilus assembly protein TraW
MLNRLLISIPLFALLFFLPSGKIHARDLGKFGATYPIAEKDALREMADRAGEVDWSKVFDREESEKKIKDYRPAGLANLPAAAGDRIFQVDMTWSSEFDVPDGKGGILYPKGYTFNPLEYVFLPHILVFVDASDRRQIEWFKSSPYRGDMRTMLLLTGGSYWDTMDSLKMPVFYATKVIIERLKLEAVPSVVVQKGLVMEVREYALDKAERGTK